MASKLRQSTAFTFRIGPFVDSLDGATAETGLTIAQADIQISKAGGAFAQTSDAAPTTTHDVDGWYQCPLTVADTATLGTLTVQITMAGALQVWREFEVVPVNVFDALVAGTDTLSVDLDALPTAVENRAEMDSNSTQLGAIKVDTGTSIPATLTAIKGEGFSTLKHSLVKIWQDITAYCGPGVGLSGVCGGSDLPLLCELWEPDVDAEDLGGGGVETFTLRFVSANCQLQGASGGETLTPQELAVGTWKFTAGRSMGIDDRWQIRNVRDGNGFAVAGLEGMSLDIITPVVALTEMGLVTMTVRLAQ